MRIIQIISLLIIVAAFVVGAYYYNQFPEQVASHWNVRGQADDYMPKFWGLFLMPLVMLGLYLLFLLLPKIDPLKKNVYKFKQYYFAFVSLVLVFLLYIHVLIILWNKGLRFDMNYPLVPAFGLLFLFLGIIMHKIKRNWFIGIRTPWTLSNEKVWEETHRFGGKLFVIAGIITCLGVLWPSAAIYFIMIPIIFVSLASVTYSYIVYTKIK